jgi:uncharacterized RDD family membrane protein YckC
VFSDHFGNSLEFEPASVPVRGIAYCIDRILLIAFWILIIYFLTKLADTSAGKSLAGSINHIDSMDHPGVAVEILATIFLVLLIFLAYLLILLPIAMFEYFFNGRSPGKFLFGIRIESENGETPSFKQILVRSLLRDLEGLLGLVFIMATSYRQTFYDTLAGTVVVRYRHKKNRPDPAAPKYISVNNFFLETKWHHHALIWQRHYRSIFAHAPASDGVRRYLVRQSAMKLAKEVPPMKKFIPDEDVKSDMIRTESVLLQFSSALDNSEVTWASL